MGLFGIWEGIQERINIEPDVRKAFVTFGDRRFFF